VPALTERDNDGRTAIHLCAGDNTSDEVINLVVLS